MNKHNFLGFLAKAFKPLDFLNKSSLGHKADALEKFFLHALVVVGFDSLVFLSVDFGYWYLIWMPIIAFTNCRYLLRFVVSSEGWTFKNLNFGYFWCDKCRRLKPARQAYHEKVEESIFCDTCAPKAIEIRERVSEMMNSLSELGRELKKR